MPQNDRHPGVIEYASGPPETPGQAFYVGSLIFGLIFLFCSNVTGMWSTVIQVTGRAPSAPVQRNVRGAPLNSSADSDLVSGWSFPATICFLLPLTVFPPRRRWGLGWPAVFCAALVGAIYSWIQQIEQKAYHPYGAAGDFAVAMGAAIWAGIITGWLRERLPDPV
jgi:hypothetical protein